MALFSQEISFSSFLQDWRSYDGQTLRKDLSAAFFVALLTIPLSIAYSLLAGLPPTAGLFSAIFGSIFVGIFGSSRHLIAGPSTGVSVLIQTSIAGILSIYHPQAVGGGKEQIVMEILIQMVFVIGVFQIIASLFHVSKLLQFVSQPVVLGYFAGVGAALVVNQLFTLCGISSANISTLVIFKFWYLLLHIFETNYVSATLGIFCLLMFFVFDKKWKNWPNALVILVIATLIGYFIQSSSFFLEKGHKISIIRDLGMDPLKFSFSFPHFSWEMMSEIIFPSLAIALLSILEVSSISRGLSARSGQEIQPAQDVFGIGMSNFLLSFLQGSMPASGSMSRSLLNFQHQGKTRFSAIFSGIFVAILLFGFWPFVQYIPLVTLASLLLFLIPSIINIEQVKITLKATKGDAFVFWLTFGSCLLFTLDVAFFLGIVISIASFLKKVAIPHLVEYAFNASGRLMVVSTNQIVHRKVRIVGISGELFFAAVDLFQSTLKAVASDPYVKVIVLRLNNVFYMDASMCFAILKLEEYLKTTKRHFVISGLTGEVLQVFQKSGLLDKIGKENIFITDETKPQLSTWRAFSYAQDLAGE
jgi:SulP family sulfate permease